MRSGALRLWTCCGCGPGSATIPVRATCMPAQWRCGAITAGRFPTANNDCARWLGSAPIPRRAWPALHLARGAVCGSERCAAVLWPTRAEKGLRGGMTEVPTSHWLAAQDDKAALGQAPRLKDIARWHRKQGTVTHVFTHFPLELVVYTASIPKRARAPTGMRWVSIATLRGEGLRNVMRNVIGHGLGD